MVYRFDSRNGDPRVRIAELLDEWTTSSAMRALVEADGGSVPTAAPLVERLETLYAFSERWDFRRGGERLDIGDDELSIDEDVVGEAAAQLGMASASRPSKSRYDHALVLGGTVLADYCRTKYLSELIAAGLEAPQVAALGALRAITEQELAIARARPDIVGEAAEPATEFDALVAAARRFFPPATPLEQSIISDEGDEHLGSATARYTDTRRRKVTVLAAASSEPARRATTIDNYRSYAAGTSDNDSILVCTSAIYLPYHFFIALRALALEKPLVVELVGFPPEWMQGVLTGTRNYLQETRSAIFGALTLARELLA